jgi:hypothetical protein
MTVNPPAEAYDEHRMHRNDPHVCPAVQPA